MSILTAHNLAKSYGPQDVLEDISLDVPHGAKIALVGLNGSGKTTLLHLLIGLEEPTAGVVQRAKGLRVAYLPQQANFSGDGTLREAMLEVFADLQAQAAELRRLETAMADPTISDEALQRYGRAVEAFELAGGYTYEQRIERVLSGLGFDEEDFRRPVAQLSGGQKTRALLARLLLEEPDLLLLDEPTNHLDLAGIEWLENYLKAWPEAVIVVAHDRAFLDAVVERVWELEWGQLRQYRGNYTAYAAQRAEQLALQQTKYERQQQSIAHTEEFIRRHIAGQRTREAQGRRKRLERLERIERPQEHQPLNLDLGDAVRSGDLVISLYELAVGYDQAAPLFAAQEFELRRGQRMALLGPNGSGKTTLVRTILGQIPPLAGEVRIGASVHPGYFAQGHADLDIEKTVIETILGASELGIGEARNLLARYRFSGDDVFKRVADLSGGEQARVALAVLALKGANFLILDEPTNHLDILSQEVLQEALSEFGGTLLHVTHDRYLIRRLATCVWAIEDGRLWEFKEGYDEYHEWQAQRDQQKRARREEARGQTERERARQARKAAQREAARQASRQAERERAIHQMEARLAQLGSELAAASQQQAVERVRRLGAEYTGLEEKLNTLLVAWTDAA
ncbi:MAG: ABC transporter ATP-binding protein [Chloroflexi bacterium]|nr:MAG: ABC transporter ATP-binding protein [Chloroflexota bacterium]